MHVHDTLETENARTSKKDKQTILCFFAVVVVTVWNVGQTESGHTDQRGRRYRQPRRRRYRRRRQTNSDTNKDDIEKNDKVKVKDSRNGAFSDLSVSLSLCLSLPFGTFPLFWSIRSPTSPLVPVSPGGALGIDL